MQGNFTRPEIRGGEDRGVMTEKRYRPTPDWWKRLVTEELDRRGRGSRLSLAKKCRCSSGAISQLLATTETGRVSQEGSRLAECVAEDTGIPLPGSDVKPEVQELIAEIMALEAQDPGILPHVRELIRAARRTARGSK